MNPFVSRRQHSCDRSDTLPAALHPRKSFCSHLSSAKRPASFPTFRCPASAAWSCRADWRRKIVERRSSLLPPFRIRESRHGHSQAGPSVFSRSRLTDRSSSNASTARSIGPTIERISRRCPGVPQAQPTGHCWGLRLPPYLVSTILPKSWLARMCACAAAASSSRKVRSMGRRSLPGHAGSAPPAPRALLRSSKAARVSVQFLAWRLLGFAPGLVGDGSER